MSAVDVAWTLLCWFALIAGLLSMWLGNVWIDRATEQTREALRAYDDACEERRETLRLLEEAIADEDDHA